MKTPRKHWLALQIVALVAVTTALSFWLQTAHMTAVTRPPIPGLPRMQLEDMMRAGLVSLALQTAARALLIGGIPPFVLLVEPGMRRRWGARAMAVWAAGTLLALAVMAIRLMAGVH